MTRATAVLRNAAKTAEKQAPMSADHTKYHLAPQGFWKKVHATLAVNPSISSGLPLPTEHRYPQPGARTEQYASPATKASDVAFNPYHKRDVRRAYPQTSYITQTHLSTLLLASPAVTSLPAPETKLETPQNSSAIAGSAENAQVAVAASDVPVLSTVLQSLPAGKAFVGGGLQTASEGSALPPLPPRIGAKWKPRPGQEIPSDPHAYFPMIGYT